MGVAEKSVLPEELNSNLHDSQSSNEERSNCTQVGWCTGTHFVNKLSSSPSAQTHKNTEILSGGK